MIPRPSTKMLTQAWTKIVIAGSRCSFNQNHDWHDTRRNLEICRHIYIYRLLNVHLILLKRSKKPSHIQMIHIVYIIYIHLYIYIYTFMYDRAT